MAIVSPARSPVAASGSQVKAVLGPTNTGKTHLAIERLCAHSSGAIGFPLRLLAREVYDRVCAIKGENRVALITGEERIEPNDARWLLCTAEAMPMQADLAFVALDEAQLAADRERGHVFTDRLLHARGREETMLLGSATLKPMIQALVPEAEIIGRPRFSTLTHSGVAKLSRLPPRSAIVAFSAEQVYAIAEMLRRYRGGAAVVMGALSPQTRNAQVALYQSGEVDYLVATDAIGMGLNLDVTHVAFAGLSKFDGVRNRRLLPAEMAQIAGRAGRHQRDGTFGTLAGTGGPSGAPPAEFTPEEVFAIEEHRFAPLSRLYWREPEPRFDSLAMLIGDLEAQPLAPQLVAAPEAIDLAVLKRLADEPDIADTLRRRTDIARFWDVCRLPDFRQHGAETHSRFVARLWQDLRQGQIGADYVAQAIAQLDNTSGDIDALQGRIAAIRSWAYIAQRPDWVLAREEMAARARAAEAKLSDALHARLTERFVNRRTSVLMKKLGTDAALLPVRMDGENVLVDGEAIGRLEGFRFRVDPATRHDDHKLLLAAADRHLPALLAERADSLARSILSGDETLDLTAGVVSWAGNRLARLGHGRSRLSPRLTADASLERVAEPQRKNLLAACQHWLDHHLRALEPLRRLEEASRSQAAGADLRALLIKLVDAGGMLERAGSGVDRLDKAQRHMLGRLGVRIGTLDLFMPAVLRPAALAAWYAVAQAPTQPSHTESARPVLKLSSRSTPFGYRRLGNQALRLDLAEKLLRDAHTARINAGRRWVRIDPAKATSMGLDSQGHVHLLRLAGFRPIQTRALTAGCHGPPPPQLWTWRPPRAVPTAGTPLQARPGNAFAELAELVR